MVTSLSGSGERGNEAPRSKAPRYFCEILRSPSTLLAYSAEAAASAAKAGRQGYGGFSSPSSSQQATRYSAKENKKGQRDSARPLPFLITQMPSSSHSASILRRT